MTIKEEVQEIIDNVLVYDVDDAGIPYLDPNASCRRHFRSWLDGSWTKGLPLPATMETVEAQNRRELREIVFYDMKYVPSEQPDVWKFGCYFPTCGYWVEGDREQGRWLRRITRRLRAWVINEFTGFLAHEANASRGTVRRHIVASTTEDGLAQLTRELIDDALEMISDGITDDPSEPELEVFDSLRDDIGRTFNRKYRKAVQA